jgi:hypothetical protein
MTAILVERTSRTTRRDQERFLANLGALYPYFALRNDPSRDIALPGLPISEQRRELMASWAKRQVDFLAPPRKLLERRAHPAQSKRD